MVIIFEVCGYFLWFDFASKLVAELSKYSRNTVILSVHKLINNFAVKKKNK